MLHSIVHYSMIASLGPDSAFAFLLFSLFCYCQFTAPYIQCCKRNMGLAGPINVSDTLLLKDMVLPFKETK